MEIRNREAALAEERKKEELKEENVFEVKEEEPVVAASVSESVQPIEVT